MTKSIFTLLLFGIFACYAQKDQKPSSNSYFDIVRPEINGNLAYETTGFMEQYWRVVGNTGFDKSVYWIAEHLEKTGYILETKASESDQLTYRIEKRAMEHPTWEPISAKLQIVGEDLPLLVSATNRNMTYLNSVSTPKEGITGTVIDIDSNKNASIKGKIVFTESRAGKFYEQLITEGALGIITYNNPSYLQPEKNKTSIQFRSLPSPKNTKLWGIALSFEARKRLKAALTKGEIEVHVNIQTKIYPSEELTVVANIKGTKTPQKRLVFSAHIQEPGANDNATGVGAQLEMATVAAKLLKANKIKMDRTLTFLWGDEIISTRRYIQEDEQRAKGIKWGISLDMVGENTQITGGSFLIEKMPDPSAIWTRGNDKHSEWGGEVLSLEEMKPHYLNDFSIQNFQEQGAFADWGVQTNPFEGGSDHTPFLDANIPGLLLWHFTDQFYHTDNDRLDKVSKETLKNVSTAALASGLQLANSDNSMALEILKNLEATASKRLKLEYELSKAEIAKGEPIIKELTILRAWEDWYHKAFESVLDMAYVSSKIVKAAIKKSQQRLRSFNKRQIQELQP